MTTLDEIQQLSDGAFHRLCDEVLARFDPRYRRIRPHGVNPSGDSIKGQPDSFVGPTVEAAEIAFCYTTETSRWWNKLTRDVEVARQACPAATEFVCATPRDAEREGPKGDWLGDLKKAVADAKVVIIDGRQLTHLLDTDYQDLRFVYLQVPYSRLTYEGVLASCRARTDRELKNLISVGRYDPERYVARRAEGDLFRIWQRSMQRDGTVTRVQFVALVTDSGLGKTSLLCRFAETFAESIPVLLVQARNVMFGGEDGLVRYIVESVQGALEPGIRCGEEAAIAHQLERRYPLTVLCDGLDEAGAPTCVRQAIGYWLESRLGRSSVLIVTSRREFWRLAMDPTWGAKMPADVEAVGRAWAVSSGKTRDPTFGLALPEPFNDEEQKLALALAGRDKAELAGLTARERFELRHPVTLRSYVDLAKSCIPHPISKTAILEASVKERLRLNEDAPKRITSAILKKTLRDLAVRLSRSEVGWLVVDDLGGVQRFDPVNPPGPVIERLLDASFLETVPGRPERIRFVDDSLQDFFAAEVEAEQVADDPEGAAESCMGGSFSRTLPLLERLATRLPRSAHRDRFVRRLVGLDSARAAVAMRNEPNAFARELRRATASGLAADLESPFHARAGFAAELLGEFPCSESRDALARHLERHCPPHLKIVGAIAVAKAGCCEAVDVMYSCPLFGLGGDSYYFANLVYILRQSLTPDFKVALSERASRDLKNRVDSDEYARAVCVLGYLADGSLVEHLATRLHERGTLEAYEAHALLAVGSEEAASLYEEWVHLVASRLHPLRPFEDSDQRYKLFRSAVPTTADLRYLLTRPFEQRIARWLSDPERELVAIGTTLARTSRSEGLSLLYVRAKYRLGSISPREEVISWIDPRTWLDWWRDAKNDETRRALVRALPGVPSPAVEEILIECLDDRDSAGRAARYLGRVGSVRAASSLRALAVEKSHAWQVRVQAMSAIADLRDSESAEALETIAHEKHTELAHAATLGLGALGTADAADRLEHLLGTVPDDWVAGALVLNGTRSAVERAVSIAERNPTCGPSWLLEPVSIALGYRGWQRGVYFTHIDPGVFEYFRKHRSRLSKRDRWDLLMLLQHVDGAAVRELLRDIALSSGDEEEVRFSELAHDELGHRGDEWAIERYVREASRPGGRWRSRQLLQFSRRAVASVVRDLLSESEEPSEQATLLRLIGFFGESADAALLMPFKDSEILELANEAFEASVRLEDPLRLPEGWSAV